MFLLKDIVLSFFLLAYSPVVWSAPSIINPRQASANPLLSVKPKVIELFKSSEQLFHEAAVYHPPTKALWVNSDSITSGNESVIYTQRITGLDSPDTVHIERINTTIPVPIGGIRYIQDTALGDVILFVAQGTKESTPPAGVYALNPYPPYNTSLVIGSYGDYPFNSPDDVTITSDGTIWFTDPPYGYTAGNRPLPLLPNQVYSYNPLTNDSRVVADGFGRPNGIAPDANGDRIYIGDTGANVGNGTTDLQGQRTIYAYDRCGSMLCNRRVFAMPNVLKSGADGIKVDTNGNVWAGVLNVGVVVWNSDGVLLGSIELDKNIGNLGFGEPGELFVLGGDRLYKIILSTDVVGVNP